MHVCVMRLSKMLITDFFLFKKQQLGITLSAHIGQADIF